MSETFIAVISFSIGMSVGALFTALPLQQALKDVLKGMGIMLFLITFGALVTFLSHSIAHEILGDEPENVNTVVTAMIGSAVSIVATLEILHPRTSPDR